MLSDDQAVGSQAAAEAAAAAYVDNDWAGQFEGAAEAGEDRAKVSGDTVPTFPYYVFHVEGAKGGLTKGAAKSPVARIFGTIIEGPEGTVGERVFDDLFLKTTRFVTENGVTSRKDDDKYAEQVEDLRKKFNKIGRIGKFQTLYPTDFSGSPEQKAQGYAKQFEFGGGFDVVIEIRETTEEYQGVKRVRNRLIWESARAVDEPAHSKKAKPGTTALEEARERIAETNKAILAKASGAGRTAGSVSRKPGTLGD